MSVSIIGTCSICGGRVTIPTFFHSVVPPVPTCESCGAIAASHGPVIPMRPRLPAVMPRVAGTSAVPQWFVVPSRTVPIPSQPDDQWPPIDVNGRTFYCSA